MNCFGFVTETKTLCETKPLDPLIVHINLHSQSISNELTIYVLDIGCREAHQNLMLMLGYSPNLMKNLC